MIPSYSITATERVLPKLALDFTAANLDPRVTFVRSTDATHPATYTNSSGIVVLATDNQPRFDYDPTTFVCKGLLIEESRTNLLKYSEQLSNPAWAAINASISDNYAIAPSNTQTADKFVESSGVSATHRLQTNISKAGTALTYTLSFYAKASGRSKLGVLLRGAATGANYAAFRVGIDGTEIAAPTASGGWIAGAASSVAVGNGWYRLNFTATSSTETAIYITIDLIDDSNQSNYIGDGVSGIIYWGVQLEAGAFATSYIPTTTTALTRNADVATMTGTNFSSWWTATNGASDVWLIPKSTSTLSYMSFDDNTANNKIVIANSTTSGQSTITSNGSLQAILTAGTIASNTINKVGCSWNTNNCAATANATTPATTASATIPTVTQLRIGNNGTAYANAWIQKLFYWSQRITDNEIQSFTK